MIPQIAKDLAEYLNTTPKSDDWYYGALTLTGADKYYNEELTELEDQSWASDVFVLTLYGRHYEVRCVAGYDEWVADHHEPDFWRAKKLASILVQEGEFDIDTIRKYLRDDHYGAWEQGAFWEEYYCLHLKALGFTWLDEVDEDLFFWQDADEPYGIQIRNFNEVRVVDQNCYPANEWDTFDSLLWVLKDRECDMDEVWAVYNS